MSEKVMTKKAAPKEEAEKKEAEKRAPEMTPEMLANFGKKAKEKRDERTLSGDQEDAKKHSSLGESRLMTLTSFLAAYETPIIPIYQRVNGWTRAQKETFKEAIARLIAHPSAEPFFIGTLSVARVRGSTRCYVIDGQQR